MTTVRAPRRQRVHVAGTLVPWLAMVLVLGAALTVAAIGTRAPATDAERVDAVARTLKCPTCQGESVAVSEALISQEIRADIRRRLTAGESPDQIRAYYVSTYGESILLTPAATGSAAIVWGLPVAAAVVCIAGLVVVFRRWNKLGALHASAADRDLVEQALRQRAGTEPRETR